MTGLIRGPSLISTGKNLADCLICPWLVYIYSWPSSSIEKTSDPSGVSVASQVFGEARAHSTTLWNCSTLSVCDEREKK
jgi:hypothetical protein